MPGHVVPGRPGPRSVRQQTLIGVQDRVIRLEERLRQATLASGQLRSRIEELSEGQLIALRFASDAELPALFERALNQKLGKADIKKSVANWRGDYFRV